MELFVIKNRKGDVVVKDQASKSVAKSLRDILQSETKAGLPPKEQRHDQNLWDFRVSKGRDHMQMAA